ncbi:Ankyrin repeat-containing protein [Spironucleus salmonicida]|uniref:Ankyrin repeat-containing protein n=1 Tax=Spironucleus salmonicida TaxID=348837 RepID=V6LJR1_9EUKA|nr:Ankyrin repeat-containing protein [Spironucleus salmonicida]|eukprot:EST43956.1 Ankyrin repeat-containing protein [Spironucleus salmonicida]
MEAWLTAARMNDIPTLTRLAPIYLSSTHNNQTALMLACRSNNFEAAEFLLAEKDILDDQDRSALFYTQTPRIANLLLSIASIPDRSGTTPPHHFAVQQNVQVCRVFFEYALLRDTKGRTPLHIAAELGNFEICEIFSEAIGAKDDEGKAALLGAVAGGFVEICRFLSSEVDEMSLRFASFSDQEILEILVGKIEDPMAISADTRQLVFEKLGLKGWGQFNGEQDGEIQVDEDVEFEAIRRQIIANQEKLDMQDQSEFKVEFE